MERPDLEHVSNPAKDVLLNCIVLSFGGEELIAMGRALIEAGEMKITVPQPTVLPTERVEAGYRDAAPRGDGR